MRTSHQRIRTRHPPQCQFAKLGPRLAVGYGLVLVALAAVAAVSWRTGIPSWVFRRDAAAVADPVDPKVYAGLLQYVAVLLWCATATVCLFGAAVVSRARGAGCRGRAAFLAAAGLLSALLCVDDLFLLHDWVLPRLLRRTEKPIHLAYAVIVAGYLIGFRK